MDRTWFLFCDISQLFFSIDMTDTPLLIILLALITGFFLGCWTVNEMHQEKLCLYEVEYCSKEQLLYKFKQKNNDRQHNRPTEIQREKNPR